MQLKPSSRPGPGHWPRASFVALLAGLLVSPGGAAGLAQDEPPAPEQVAPAPEVPQPTVQPPRFMAGRAVDLSEIAGSVIYWGESATVEGTLGHNALLGGARVSTIEGSHIEGDLLAFAGSIMIDGEVMHDVWAWAGDVHIGRNAVIHGNVIAFAGELRVEGTVHGTVQGGGGRTVISGEVGALDLEAGTLTLAPSAVVHRDIVYRSNEEAEIDPAARVGGRVTHNVDPPDEDEPESGGITFWSVAWRAWRYLTSLIVGFALLLLGGRGARAPAARLRQSAASSLGFGFVISVVVPVGCLLAILLLVTLPLGLMMLVLFMLAIYIGGLVTAQSAGELVLRRLTGREPSEYLALALGLLLLTPLAWVPYAGLLVRYFAAILGLGAIYLALRDAGFPWTTSRPRVAATSS